MTALASTRFPMIDDFKQRFNLGKDFVVVADSGLMNKKSVDKVLEAAKTITTIRVWMPENGTYFTKTLFLTEKHLAVKPLFDLTDNE